MADPWRPFNKFVSSSCVTSSFMFPWHRVPSVFSLPTGAAQGRDEPNLDSVLVLLLTGCVGLCFLVCVPNSSSLTGFIGGLNKLMSRGLNELVNSWLNEWIKLLLSTVFFPTSFTCQNLSILQNPVEWPFLSRCPCFHLSRINLFSLLP